eukprot:scaffold29819_cov31-Tisochrysis_lutea.AAC.1
MPSEKGAKRRNCSSWDARAPALNIMRIRVAVGKHRRAAAGPGHCSKQGACVVVGHSFHARKACGYEGVEPSAARSAMCSYIGTAEPASLSPTWRRTEASSCAYPTLSGAETASAAATSREPRAASRYRCDS